MFIFREFLKLYESRIIPLTKEVNLANFEASVTGKNESYKKKERLEIRLNTLYSNKKEFADLKKLKESGAIKEPLLIRQLEILYNTYLANQINEGKLENIIKLQTQIEQHFFVFRTNVAGKYLTDGTHFYDVILFT